MPQELHNLCFFFQAHVFVPACNAAMELVSMSVSVICVYSLELPSMFYFYMFLLLCTPSVIILLPSSLFQFNSIQVI